MLLTSMPSNSVKFHQFILNMSKFLFLNYNKYANKTSAKQYRLIMNTQRVIDLLVSKVGWNKIQTNLFLFPEFLETHYQHLDKKIISQKQKLPMEFIDNHIDELPINIICRFQKLTPEIIRKHYSKLHWRNLLIFQKVPEDIIDLYYQTYLNNIRYLTRLQLRLSELSESINWDTLCCFQILSDQFITKYHDKIKWKFLSRNQKLINYEFIKKYLHKLHRTPQICNIIQKQQATLKLNKIYYNIPEDIQIFVIQYI